MLSVLQDFRCSTTHCGDQQDVLQCLPERARHADASPQPSEVQWLRQESGSGMSAAALTMPSLGCQAVAVTIMQMS